jgi:hypothetical protein
MALSQTNYEGPQIIAEWSATKVAPNGSVKSNTAGTNPNGADNSITVVRAAGGSTALPEGKAADVYALEFTSPIASDGSYPDATVTISVGNKELHQFQLQAGHHRNMLPPTHRIAGWPAVRQVALGESMRVYFFRMIRARQARQNLLSVAGNLPLKITGIKVPANTPLTVTVSSIAGWGQSGTAVRPLGIKAIGDVWTSEELAAFGPYYAQVGAFAQTVLPNPATVEGVHTVSTSQLGASTIGQLPGGMDQTGKVVILRSLIEAGNNLAIPSTGVYAYSNLSSVGGAENHVSDAYHDLGVNATSGAQAFLFSELGFRFAESLVGSGPDPNVYVGWYVNSKIVPDDSDNGVYITASDNRFQYGSQAPLLADTGLYLPLGPASRLAKVLAYRNTVAPAVVSNNGTSLAANQLYCVRGGVSIQFTNVA